MKSFHWCLIILVLNLAPALADKDAASCWKGAVERVESAKDYRVVCHYTNPRGTFHLDCLAVAPNRVRTKVLQGSDRLTGTIAVYDPALSPGKVLLRFPSGSVVLREIGHQEMKDTPLYQSLYGALIERVGKLSPTLADSSDGSEQLDFQSEDGESTSIWINSRSEIVRAEVRKGKTVLESFRFENPAWDTGQSVSFDK
ncbi:MAG: hypothetical protein KC910_00785 [Candidatus Eremiobacteraeota bacterium]|nr:hypothetical protein [Candidatus Eremiobacteraeota bacterium]